MNTTTISLVNPPPGVTMQDNGVGEQENTNDHITITVPSSPTPAVYHVEITVQGHNGEKVIDKTIIIRVN